MPSLCFTVLTRFVGEPVGFVATFIVVWNTLLVTGFDDWSNVHHDPMVAFPLLATPTIGYTLSSPILSLLLGKYSSCSWKAFV
jgi:hypothetical protein